MRRFAVLFATAGGAGYAPFAPGTVGSSVGLALYLLTRSWPLAWQASVVVGVSLAGIWASGVAERHFGREDPGQVVIDEVAGQLVTLFATGAGLWGATLGFLAFRLLDIYKPWPARRLESLHGGLGIMADDLVVGVYGNVLLRLVELIVPGL